MPLDETEPDAAVAWPAIDPTLLDDARPAPPPFPLDLFPEFWRGWILNIARNAVAPVDHSAQGLLAVVAAACGAGVVVQVTPAWSEPLLLWQAMVGGPASGPARVLGGSRYLFDDLRPAEEDLAAPAVVAEGTAKDLRKALDRCWRAVLLWREELADWMAEARDRDERPGWLAGWRAEQAVLNRRSAEPLDFHRFPLCLAGTLRPDRLAESFAGGDDRLAALFLYSWPELGTPLGDWGERVRSPRPCLERIADLAGGDDYAWTLQLTKQAVARLEEIVAVLRRLMRESDGLEAAWIGNGQSMVVRLAGLLALMRWSHDTDEGSASLNRVDRRDVDDAWTLWHDYFLRHAQRVFGGVGPIDRDRHVRRAMRWLKRTSLAEISREDIRVAALSKSVDAEGTDEVIARLESAAVLRPLVVGSAGRRGRPRLRWSVNPALG